MGTCRCEFKLNYSILEKDDFQTEFQLIFEQVESLLKTSRFRQFEFQSD